LFLSLNSDFLMLHSFHLFHDQLKSNQKLIIFCLEEFNNFLYMYFKN